MTGSLRPHLDSLSLEALSNSAKSQNHGFRFIPGYKANQQREKELWVKPRGSQTQASKIALPAEWHRTYLSAPVMSCDNPCEGLAIMEAK